MSSRSYCESSIFLDIRRLAREGQLELPSPFKISWQREGTVIGSVEVFCQSKEVRLRYSYRRVQADACTSDESDRGFCIPPSTMSANAWVESRCSI
jgi:hypothetical protein